MYARSIYPDVNEKISVPDNYDGTAFMEKEPSQGDYMAASAEITPTKTGDNESVSVGLQKIPILSGLFGDGSPFSHLSLRLPTIGTEEILLIATAAFLFFSRNGDKESALLLLFLLLIN